MLENMWNSGVACIEPEQCSEIHTYIKTWKFITREFFRKNFLRGKIPKNSVVDNSSFPVCACFLLLCFGSWYTCSHLSVLLTQQYGITCQWFNKFWKLEAYPLEVGDGRFIREVCCRVARWMLAHTSSAVHAHFSRSFSFSAGCQWNLP
jgi:hypothetical protein